MKFSDQKLMQNLFNMITGNETPGVQLCKLLLHPCTFTTGNAFLTRSLSSVLCISGDGKKFALKSGLATDLIQRLGDICLELSLESVDSIRKTANAKKLSPKLEELESIVGLIANFMLGDADVKTSFAVGGLIEVMQKLWIWFFVQRSLQITVLKMICVFSTDCCEGGL